MPSLKYNSAVLDEAVGGINYASDIFYAMLVSGSYAPNKDAHTRRSHVTGEASGAGYVSGGIPITVSVGSVDTLNDRVVITFAAHSWPGVSISARGEVVYKRRGGDPAQDELIYYNDFGSTVSETGGVFHVAASTLTKQN